MDFITETIARSSGQFIEPEEKSFSTAPAASSSSGASAASSSSRDDAVSSSSSSVFEKYPSNATVTKLKSTLEIKQCWLNSEWDENCQFSRFIRPSFPRACRQLRINLYSSSSQAGEGVAS